jgi:DNA-binding NarL/FixJ family response regulator
MIYLIDDKKTRQKDFGWTQEKFAQYAHCLTLLFNIDDVSNVGETLYNDGNIILYHESFLDFTGDRDKAVYQRNKLTEKTSANNGLSVAFFSGSQSSRSLDGNMAFLPVDIVYKNLEVLVQQYNQQNGHLKHLLFGESPEIEEKLSELLTQANREIEEDAIGLSGKTIFIHPDEDFIQNAILGGDTEELYQDEDQCLHEKTIELLSKIEYDNIFIPLCFGQTLSDYNGLRLATHIRCTPIPNQLTRVFIYGFVGLDYLINHEYFNILKTKNVELISYSKTAFAEAVNTHFQALKIEELPQEISRLKLDPPYNYSDSHSIANEWAIHQWAKTIGCEETDELAKVFQNIESNLYFKYLRAAHPISKSDKVSPDKLKINYDGKPKVLLIDDEAEKGWFEIFAHLLDDLNGIHVDSIGHNFKNQIQEEIIDQSMEKIIEDDIDVVILDFRLNPNDFIVSNPKDISSIRLLEKIKNFNPGIQVIIFSATNKALNLQALQAAGADGFIFKAGSENIHQTINSLTDQMLLSLKKASWLKPIWSKTKSIINHLENQRRNHVLDRDFTGAINTFLELGFESLLNEQNKFSYDSAFMYYFLILEALSKQLIDEDTPHEIDYTNIHGETKKGFKFQFRSNYSFLTDFKGNRYMRVAIGDDLVSSNRRIPYNPKFHNLISFARIQGVDPISIVDLRNRFNHPDLIENRRIAVIEREHIDRIFDVCNKLLNNL